MPETLKSTSVGTEKARLTKTNYYGNSLAFNLVKILQKRGRKVEYQLLLCNYKTIENNYKQKIILVFCDFDISFVRSPRGFKDLLKDTST